MAPRLLALLTCDAFASDPSGKVTIYGIFDRISLPALPGRVGQFAVYWRIETDTPGEVTVRLLRPDGTDLVNPYKLPLSNVGIAAGAMMLAGIEFPVAGQYSIEILFNEEGLGRIPLFVTSKDADKLS